MRRFSESIDAIAFYFLSHVFAETTTLRYVNWHSDHVLKGALNPAVLKQVINDRWIQVDQDINVTVGALFAASDGSEDVSMSDANLFQVALMRSKEAQDAQRVRSDFSVGPFPRDVVHDQLLKIARKFLAFRSGLFSRLGKKVSFHPERDNILHA
jgi:hypothetical protein